MGGVLRLYDEPPRGAAPVYAVFGDGLVRDDSVDDAQRHTHRLALIVHGKPGSARSACEAAERIAALLVDIDPELDGHRLVTLRVAEIAAIRDDATGATRAVLTIEAISEVAQP